MPVAILLLLTLVCTFNLHAQIDATLKHLQNNVDELSIRNDSAKTLVAFVVTAKQLPLSAASSKAPIVLFCDPILDPADRPLGPKEHRVLMTNGLSPSRHYPAGRGLMDNPVHSAGIFDDGSSIGDPSLLNRLLARRASMLLAVDMTLETLLVAGRRNAPRDQLIEQFQRLADSVNRWYLPPEQQVGRRLYQSIVGKLVNLPRGEVGSPFPPGDFVAQETAALNRQRVTLSESQPSLADGPFAVAQ